VLPWAWPPVLFGISGFLQNHRGVMQLPQGDSTAVSRVELPVPEEARASQDALRQWLRDTQHLDLESQRGGLIMWSRGRTLRQMIFSIVGAAHSSRR
jgi:hypothetical protein